MIRMDAVRHRLDQIDVNAAPFMARELESVEAEIYRFRERELLYRALIPVSNRDNPGAETITYRMYGKVGMAKVITDYSQDLPRADIYGTAVSQPVRSLGVSVGWSQQEIRAAMMAGVGLEVEKAAAQRRAIREAEHRIAFNGDAATGIAGFISNVNIPTLAAPNGGGGLPTWVSKTTAEVLADIHLMVSTFRTQSLGVHKADTLLLPNPQYNLIAMRAVSATNETTVLEYILKNPKAFGITRIEPLFTELTQAFVGNTVDGAVLYENTRENFELRIPLELQLLPMQEKGLEVIVPGESRIGGVVVRYPLAFLFFTGI